MSALIFARRFTAVVASSLKTSTSTYIAAARRRTSTSTKANAMYGDNCPLALSPRNLRDLRARRRDVVVLDASWHMPNSPRKAQHEFLAKRIVGALYLDLDDVASPHELGLKHMMPSSESFARACGTRFGFVMARMTAAFTRMPR